METMTAVTELLVGLACLALAVPAWRRGGWVRLVAAALGVAGAAAVVNAVASLAG